MEQHPEYSVLRPAVIIAATGIARALALGDFKGVPTERHIPKPIEGPNGETASAKHILGGSAQKQAY